MHSGRMLVRQGSFPSLYASAKSLFKRQAPPILAPFPLFFWRGKLVSASLSLFFYVSFPLIIIIIKNPPCEFCHMASNTACFYRVFSLDLNKNTHIAWRKRELFGEKKGKYRQSALMPAVWAQRSHWALLFCMLLKNVLRVNIFLR